MSMPSDRLSKLLNITIEPYLDAPASYHEYDPDVPTVARLLNATVMAVGAGLAIEHIGSTAVPGCAGKGVIDLMVLYPSGDLALAKRTLDELGFQRQGTRDPFPEDRPMRIGTVAHNGKRFRVHVHVIAVDAAESAELGRSGIACVQTLSSAWPTRRANGASWRRA